MNAQEDERGRSWLTGAQRRYNLRRKAARLALRELLGENDLVDREDNLPSFRQSNTSFTLASRLGALFSALVFFCCNVYHRVFSPQSFNRCVTHTLVCLLVCIVFIGEQWQSWSLQAVAPWQERGVALGGGGTAEATWSEEREARVLPLQLAPEEQRVVPIELEQLAPVMRAPLRVVDVFHNTHMLAEGETLGAVAEQYNLTLETVIWSNGLHNGDILAVGQTLRIPRTSGLPYTIRSGDTLADVAARFQVAPEAILLFEPNKLHPNAPLPAGQEIFIPGGVQPLPDTLVALCGGREGLAASMAQVAGVIREMKTNMREGPSQEYARVMQLEAGRRAQLLARHADWLKVDVAGTAGWIRTDLLMIPEGVVAALPETNDFPPPPPIWVWPTRGSITSYFGPRWGGFHNGVDIANRAWTPIVAARAGRVTEAGWCSGYGYCVKMTHSGGVRTIYGHLIDDPVVDVGDEIAVGEIIGYMGSTYDRRGGGYSTGVHLHFTITVNGKAVNPLTFLP